MSSLKLLVRLAIGMAALGFPVSAEIQKNSHIFALVELDRICVGQSEATGEFVRVQIYKTNNGDLLTYMMNVHGQRFGSNGGRGENKLNDSEFVTELFVDPRAFRYSEEGTLSIGKRTAVSKFSVEITADSNSCEVTSCVMTLSEIGAGSACKFRCYPEACEVRKGPAS